MLEVGAIRNSFNDAGPPARLRDRPGAAIVRLGVMLGVAKAEAIHLQSLDCAAETAIGRTPEVRLVYPGRARLMYDIARHYRDEIVPNAKRIRTRTRFATTAALIGVRAVADARAQIASVNGAIETLRDFCRASRSPTWR